MQQRTHLRQHQLVAGAPAVLILILLYLVLTIQLHVSSLRPQPHFKATSFIFSVYLHFPPLNLVPKHMCSIYKSIQAIVRQAQPILGVLSHGQRLRHRSQSVALKNKKVALDPPKRHVAQRKRMSSYHEHWIDSIDRGYRYWSTPAATDCRVFNGMIFVCSFINHVRFLKHDKIYTLQQHPHGVLSRPHSRAFRRDFQQPSDTDNLLFLQRRPTTFCLMTSPTYRPTQNSQANAIVPRPASASA